MNDRSQLDFVVEVGSRPYPGASERRCTADVYEQALASAEDRRESFGWDGSILRDGEVQPLPPGDYEVYGVAGVHRSEPLRLTVREP
jgi:hypothetical protein